MQNKKKNQLNYEALLKKNKTSLTGFKNLKNSQTTSNMIKQPKLTSQGGETNTSQRLNTIDSNQQLRMPQPMTQINRNDVSPKSKYRMMNQNKRRAAARLKSPTLPKFGIQKSHGNQVYESYGIEDDQHID